jgi:hypothetical protein
MVPEEESPGAAFQFLPEVWSHAGFHGTKLQGMRQCIVEFQTINISELRCQT